MFFDKITFSLLMISIFAENNLHSDLNKVAKWANSIYVLKQHDQLR